jgi:hypothetical protein
MAISLMNKFSAEDPYSALTPEQSEYARKVAAAREAARHSTGPKTGEGKPPLLRTPGNTASPAQP